VKLLPPILLLLFAACSSAAQPRDAVTAVKSVTTGEAVRIETPVRFWQAGKWIESRDAVVLQVQVVNPADFAPRDIAEPQFVYGRAVCKVLVSPFLDGTAVLLAPPLRAGDPDELRIVPALQVARLTPQAFERILARGRPVVLPKRSGGTAPAPRAVPSLEKLRDEWIARRRELPR